MSFPAGCKATVYELRAQGLTTRDIAAELRTRYPHATIPDDSTVWRWLSDPDANALVQQGAARIRAIAAQRTADVIGGTYEGLAAAVAEKDAKSVDAWSRAVVNLTRGFVQERLEVTPGAPDAPDELASLLLRHGVALEQRVNAARISETPASGNTSSA